MKVTKPLGLGLIVGLLAMAFAAVPAVASAAPQLTEPSGAAVPENATITGTSTNAVTVLTGAGTLKCGKVVVHGIVTKNTGTLVEVAMDGEADTAEGCTLEGSPVSVKPTLTSIKLTPTEKLAVFDFTAGTAAETSTSTITYTSGASSIHVEGPVSGTLPGSFSGDFALTNASGKAIKVD